MSVSCTTVPTLTSTVTITTQITTTTLVDSLTTGPPTTRPIGTTTTCLGSVTPAISASNEVPVPVCTASTVITQLTTIPGGVQTVQVPLVQTIPTIITSPTVLFGTACVTNPGPGGGNGGGNSGGNGGGGNESGGGGKGSDVVTTPSSIITTQSETTLDNGQVSTVIVTKTTLLPPSTIVRPPPTSPGTQNNNDGTAEDRSALGAIIGGTVGGFFGLIVIVVAIWFFIKHRRRRWDDIFDDTFNDGSAGGGGSGHGAKGSVGSKRFSLSADLDEMEPKPYQYGLLGQPTSSSGHSNVRTAPVPPMMSRPSTAGSNYPLLGGTISGQNYVTSAGSSQPHTPSVSQSHSPNTSEATPSWLAGQTSVPSHSLSSDATAENPFVPRAGSPVSILDPQPRRLQVTNGPPPSIYGGQSMHQRMLSDDSLPEMSRNLTVVNPEPASTTSGVDPAMKRELPRRKTSIPPPDEAKSNPGVIIADNGLPKLVLNL